VTSARRDWKSMGLLGWFLGGKGVFVKKRLEGVLLKNDWKGDLGLNFATFVIISKFTLSISV
jgi:hypothetical protein